MSWLKCRCGHIIRDSSDYIGYKGHIMPDQDEGDCFDRVEEIINSDNPDKNNLMFDFLCEINDKIIYQCTECGRLYIEGKEQYYCFVPENHDNKNILKSVHGENWKGFLHAEWNEKKYEWQKYKGWVCADVNYPCENIYSDDRQEVIDGYYSLFNKLKQLEVIRHATLRINGKLIHEWNNS